MKYGLIGKSLAHSPLLLSGWGAALRDENIAFLKQNDKIVFLDRSIDNLISTDSRPLAKDKTDLEKPYKQRHEIYNKACDLKVSVKKKKPRCDFTSGF